MPTVRTNQPAPLARTIRVAASGSAPRPGVAPALSTGRAPAPTQMRMAATERMKNERPNFRTPDDYKNYVIKFGGYMKAAQQDLAIAQREYDQVQGVLKSAEAEYRRPLDEARRSLADTEKLYQGPVDQAASDLVTAKAELDAALYPGHVRAGQLDAEVSALGEAIGRLDAQLGTARDRVGRMDGLLAEARERQSSAETDKATADAEIRQIGAQVPGGHTVEQHRAETQSVAESTRRALDEANQALTRVRDADTRRAGELEARSRDLASRVSGLEGEIREAESRQAAMAGLLATETTRRDTAAGNRRDEQAAVDRLSPQVNPSALESQRSRTQQVEAGWRQAQETVTRASSDVERKRKADTAVDTLTSLKSNYGAAAEARSSAKSQVDTTKQALDQAQSQSGELDAQRARWRDAEGRVATAKEATSKAQAAVTRKQQLDTAVDTLASMKAELSTAEHSRSGHKGDVTSKKRALDEAMASGDGTKVTPAKSAYDEAMLKWNESNQKVKAIESRLSGFGANADSIDSVLASKRSEAQGLSDAPSALERARQAERAAQSASDSEKSKLDGMSGVAARITAAKSSYDEAVRRFSDADGRVRSMESQLSSYGASASTIASVLASKQSEAQSLSGAPAALERASSAERTARSAFDSEKAKLGQMSELADELKAHQVRRDEATRTFDAASSRLASLIAERASLGSGLPSLESRLATTRREQQSADDETSREHSRQASSNYLASERRRVQDADGAYQPAKAAYDGALALVKAMDEQRERRANDLRTIEGAKASTASLTAEKAQLPTTIKQLESDLAAKRQAKERTATEAQRERDRQNPADHPQVTGARKRVDAATARLAQARATHDEKVGGLKATVDGAQKTYNSQMAALRARADAAAPALAAARQGVDEVLKEFDGLKTAVSGTKRTWWKLVNHFDVDAFWKEQGAQIRKELVEARGAG